MKTLRHVVAGGLAALLVALAAPGFAQSSMRVDGFDVEQVTQLSPGTQLNFSVFGTPGAQAMLNIDGARAPLTLVETQPGVYEGSYTIAEQDRIVPDSRVTAQLQLRDQRVTSTLEEPLLLGARAARAARAVPGYSGAVPGTARAEPGAEPGYAAVPPVCTDCGVVEAVDRASTARSNGTLGAIAGGVVGAIVGNQVGRGDGRTLARILGAIGGAYAGREMDRRNSSVATRYDVVVRLPNGGRQIVAYANPPPFKVGDRVRLEDGRLRLFQ